MSLGEFLLARIGEDEAAARAASAGPWRYNPGKVWHRDPDKLARARSGNPFVTGGEEFVAAGPDDGLNETTLGVASTGPADDPNAMADAAHIARHDPARVLAECAAKRALVALASGWAHEYNDDDTWYSCGLATGYYDDEPASGCADDGKHGRCTCGLEVRVLAVLAPLAAIYADHPDYDPDWA